jgi:mono/diheme cytochrome c family protein
MKPHRTPDSTAASGGAELTPAPGAGQRGWLPMWIVLLMVVLFYRGCLYVDKHGGGFSPLVHAPFASTNQLALYVPKSAEDELFLKGRAAYQTFCMPCHQPSGLGAPGVAPPLAGSEWVLTARSDRLIRIVLHGLAGPIKVLGQDWNLAMLPWKDTMDDAQIAAVLTYVRGNREWGNTAGPVKAEEVAAIRKAEAGRALNWTAAELDKIPVD